MYKIVALLSLLFSSQVSLAELVDESLSDKIFMDGRIITSDDGARLIKHKISFICVGWILRVVITLIVMN